MSDIGLALRTAYDLAYQISPIVLVDGIVSGAQGGALPIIYFYGVIGVFTDATAPETYPRFLPLPGGTLVRNEVGTYPFANQYVAANALIVQPLTISLRMIAPVNSAGGYYTKLAMFTALQNSLAQHCALAGTFTVATPAFVYANLLLTGMTDISHGEGMQQQIEWQLDFVQPILTTASASAAQNALMSKLTNGSSFKGAPSWSGNTSSTNPGTAAGLPAVIGNFGGL